MHIAYISGAFFAYAPTQKCPLSFFKIPPCPEHLFIFSLFAEFSWDFLFLHGMCHKTMDLGFTYSFGWSEIVDERYGTVRSFKLSVQYNYCPRDIRPHHFSLPSIYLNTTKVSNALTSKRSAPSLLNSQRILDSENFCVRIYIG